MCKSKMSVDAAQPTRSPRTPRTPTQYPSDRSSFEPTSGSGGGATAAFYTSSSTSGGGYKLSVSGSSSSSAAASLSSLRQTLPENLAIYDLSELRSATNNFLSTRRSSSSSSWRCSLRGKDVIVFQRRFKRRRLGNDQLRDLLGALSRSHLSSIAKLLGACLSGEDIYLVYEYVTGASLSDCLRNPKNPSFTLLSSWISRIQVATDVAHALDYIHHKTGLSINLVHNHVKSSSIIVTEPGLRAKLSHFGTAQLCGEADENNAAISPGEIIEEGLNSPSSSRELTRSNSRVMQFQGVRGYMSPEFRANGIATQKSDVYSFGVVILELLSGEEPFKYRYDKAKGDFIRTSLIDTARTAIEGDEAEGRLRHWIDRRLRDSFPVEAAMKLIGLALDCLQEDPNKRPDMSRVAGKISKLYVQSKTWSDNVNIPTNISVSLAPR